MGASKTYLNSIKNKQNIETDPTIHCLNNINKLVRIALNLSRLISQQFHNLIAIVDEVFVKPS